MRPRPFSIWFALAHIYVNKKSYKARSFLKEASLIFIYPKHALSALSLIYVCRWLFFNDLASFGIRPKLQSLVNSVLKPNGTGNPMLLSLST